MNSAIQASGFSWQTQFLDAGFRQTNARSGAGLKTWTVIFVLVVLQMSAALRPLLGRADTFLPTEKNSFSHTGAIA